MHLMAWINSWESECCGQPFAVNSRVRWQAETNEELVTLGRDLDVPPPGFGTTHVVTYHPGTAQLGTFGGTVAGIWAGWARLPLVGTPNSEIVDLLMVPAQYSPFDRDLDDPWICLGTAVQLADVSWALTSRDH